jgi:hypothetical protein
LVGAIFIHDMSFREELSGISGEEVDKVVRRLADDGYFRYPIKPAAESQLLDVIRWELPSLSRASELLSQILNDESSSQGWTTEQAALLSTGADMALLILHVLLEDRKKD